MRLCQGTTSVVPKKFVHFGLNSSCFVRMYSWLQARFVGMKQSGLCQGTTSVVLKFRPLKIKNILGNQCWFEQEKPWVFASMGLPS